MNRKAATNEEELEEFRQLIAGEIDPNRAGYFTRPTSDVHGNCLELERRGLIRRLDVAIDIGDVVVWVTADYSYN